MERSIIAFISLGFGCGGPEYGDYGTFTVNVTEEENKAINEIANMSCKDYKRVALKEKYPELDEKIVKAAKGLVRDVLINSAELEGPLSDKDREAMSKLTYHEQANYLAKHFKDLEPDDEQLGFAEVCYYLSDDEIPNDIPIRYNE